MPTGVDIERGKGVAHDGSDRPQRVLHRDPALQITERGGIALPAVSDNGSGGACAIEDPVTFQSVAMPDVSKVELDSAVTVRCTFALEVVNWVREELHYARHARPGAKETTYKEGRAVLGDQGVRIAGYDGGDGWFRRNRGSKRSLSSCGPRAPTRRSNA